MFAAISLDLSRTAPEAQVVVLNEVAAEAGYMRLEDLLYRDQPKAERLVQSIGYGDEWKWYQANCRLNAREAFLYYVRRDMGLE